MNMYLDIDSHGEYSIHNISMDELNAIIRGLTGFYTIRDYFADSLSSKVGMHLLLQKRKLSSNGKPDKVSDGEP